MMRIAYVINSLEGGGAAAPLPALVRVMEAQGCAVRVLALTPRDRRGLPPLERAGIPTYIREGGEADHFAALRWLDAQLSDWRPDLIWTSLTRATLIGQIVGQRRGIAVVSWQHNAFLKPFNLLLLRLRQRRSLLWVADSECVAELTHRRLKVGRDRIATWPLFAADADAPQARPWRADEPIRIGSLGRLHPNKGYDVLIAALVRLRANGFAAPAPVEIEIAGDGAAHTDLVAQAAAMNIHNLRFVGFTEPRRFLASLHLYVQPSRSEGLCIASHEAMQAGLPVLASAVGELRHSILDRQTGRLVAPEDPATLAAALADLLADPAGLAAMGRAARARMLERFGSEAFADAGAGIIRRIRRERAVPEI
jgi:glycosyltransferase involved in cell wall biosynthesis